MTSLDSQFLRAVVLMVAFKPKAMLRAQAALLLIGLSRREFTAADLPGEIAGKHISGAATGALISEGLLEVIGRVKSPNPNAKGRKLDLVRLASVELAKTWLKTNGIDPGQDLAQPDLFQSDVQGSTFEVQGSTVCPIPLTPIPLTCS